jgi:dipeptidyl aminopeptidase/acylaminoacyl peptidase
MGMLTTPGEFKSGAALRSVTDWAHNHGYTDILNFQKQTTGL